MAQSMKWKDKLLSSGVPFEYRISQFVIEHGFSVSSEYKYTRLDAGHAKEFSVDIFASKSISIKNFSGGWYCPINALLECKL